MLVPFYNPRNPDETFEKNSYKWIDLKIFLNTLDDEITNKFKDLSAFKLDEIYNGKYDNLILNINPISIDGDNFVDFKTFLIASKLLYTTGFTCKYGYWKKGEITSYGYPHHGIDLILPKNTPIESFSNGTVYDIKIWDGKKKNEGNCIIIKSEINGETLYFCYEHLEKILVKKGEKIKKGQKIGTCGKTGNSSTYHLHFQIDTDKASFHPFWNKGEDSLIKTYTNCIDPWDWLIKNYDNKENNTTNNNTSNIKENNEKDIISSIVDELNNKTNSIETENKTKNISYENKNNNERNINNDIKNKDNKIEEHISKNTKEPELIDSILNNLGKNDNNNIGYINFFINAGILKGDHGDYLLESKLTRFQFVLILNRLNKSGLIQLEYKDCNINFDDISELKNNKEFMEGLKLCVCNHILTGDNGKFLAGNFLTGKQFLAIIGRIFGKLENGKKIWYEPYFKWAIKNKYIGEKWEFLDKNITRNEIFKILGKILM